MRKRHLSPTSSVGFRCPRFRASERRLGMRKLFAVLLIGLLVGCASNARPNQPVLPTAAVTPELIERETTRLNEWFDARFEEQLDFSPQTKTRLGRKDDYDKLNDVSETAQDMWFEWRRQTVSALTKDFDYALLNTGSEDLVRFVGLPARAGGSGATVSKARLHLQSDGRAAHRSTIVPDHVSPRRQRGRHGRVYCAHP